jgi:hypothetical protein
MRRLLSVLFFVVAATSIHCSEPVTLLLHALPVDKEKSYIFVAVENVIELHEPLGRWMPNCLVEVEPGAEVFWYIRKVERADEVIHYTFGLKSGNSPAVEWSSAGANRGNDEVLQPVVRNVDSDVMVEIFPKSVSRAKRHMIISKSSSLDKLKEKHSIYVGQPGFVWQPIKITRP